MKTNQTNTKDTLKHPAGLTNSPGTAGSTPKDRASQPLFLELSGASRRQFLKTTATFIAAPFILPSHLWSGETPPSKRITVGLIGMGKRMRSLMGNCLANPEIQVLAVCDVDTTRRELAKKAVEEAYGNAQGGRYQGCAAYNDFRELIARKDIDAVMIATPDHWHAIIALAALNAGKDVYGEKPLTHNIHEALALVEATRQHKRIFQTGSQQRSSAEFRVACELVRNNIIGPLQRVEAHFGGPAKPNAFPEERMEPGLDWNFWCGPAPLVPYSTQLSPRGVAKHFPAWRKAREFGGGGVCDWGAHHLDIAQWGLGEDGRGPVEVIPPAGWEDAKEGVRLIYANGIPLTHDGKGSGVSFFGKDGEVHVGRGKFKFILKGKAIHQFWDKDTVEDTSVSREVSATEREYLANAKVRLYNSPNHYSDWLTSMKTRKPPISDVAIGSSSVISCHLVNLAYYHGARMKWDPEQHTFVSGGDPKWLTREYRGEWKV